MSSSICRYLALPIFSFLSFLVCVPTQTKADRRLPAFIPKFQIIGAPEELEYLGDAIPVFFRTALLNSDSITYLAEGRNAEIAIEGRILYFRGTIRLDAKILRIATGKFAVINSSVVKSEDVYSAVKELAIALQENLANLVSDGSIHKVAVTCFEDKNQRDNDAEMLGSELSFYLSEHLSPPLGLSLVPWQQANDWCSPMPAAETLKSAGVDALVGGQIVITDDIIEISPDIYFIDPPAVAHLPPLQASSETYQKIEEILLRDTQDVISALFDGNQWSTSAVSNLNVPVEQLTTELNEILETDQNTGLALLLVGQAISKYPKNAEVLISLGRVRLARGQGDEALKAFSNAERISGPTPVVSRWIGEAHVELNNFPAAIENYERAAAASEDPEDPSISIRLGEIYLLDSKLDKALERAQAVLRRDPHNVDAHLLVGNIFRYQGRFDEAEKALNAVLESEPNNRLARTSLAEILIRQATAALDTKSLEAALASARRSVEIYPRPGNTTLLIQILNEKREFREALSIFRDAEEAGRANALMYSAAAAAFFGAGEVDETFRSFDKALALPETEPTIRQAILLNKASFLVKATRYNQASSLLREIESTCDPEWMVINRYSAWVEMGQADRGLYVLDKALEKNPENIRAIESRGFILGRLSRNQEALESIDKVLEIDPVNISALTNRAWILGELGRYQEAVDTANKVLEQSPNSPNGRNHKGFSLFHLGEIDAGIALIKEAFTLNPNYGGAHFNLARVYASQRRVQEAKRELNLAYEADSWYREMALHDKTLEKFFFRRPK